MANSDKNILITPNVGAATGTLPSIRFTGADNTPITMRVLDNGTLSFEATAGQLFSISDGLTGSIFSVNDISGIPSIEVLDTGLVKLNQYNGQTVLGGANAIGTARLSIFPSAAASLGLVIRGLTSQSGNLQEWQDVNTNTLAKVDQSGNLTATSFIKTGGTSSQYLMADGSVTTASNDIIPLDDISNLFDGLTYRFIPKYQGSQVTISNQFRLLLTINGIIQYIDSPDYVWMSGVPRRGFFVDSEGYLQFSEAVPAGSEFDARLMSGTVTTTRTRVYPFKAVDILLGG